MPTRRLLGRDIALSGESFGLVHPKDVVLALIFRGVGGVQGHPSFFEDILHPGAHGNSLHAFIIIIEAGLGAVRLGVVSRNDGSSMLSKRDAGQGNVLVTTDDCGSSTDKFLSIQTSHPC
jgi:hypothetical protein